MDTPISNGGLSSPPTHVNKHLLEVELQSRPSLPIKGNFPDDIRQLYSDSCVSLTEEAGSVDHEGCTGEDHSWKSRLRTWGRSSEPASAWIALFLFFVPLYIFIGCDTISFSVYSVAYAEHFVNTSRLSIGIIYALKMSVIYFTGIVTSVLIARYGCRQISMAGGTIMFASLTISSFVNHVYVLHITLGLVMGVGMSFCIMGLNISIQKRFDKNRAMASGIALLGMTVGNSVSGPLFNFLIDKYTWRGSLLIHAAIMANIIPLSMAMAGADTNDQPKQAHKGCCDGIHSFLQDIFDFSMMKNIPFLLVCLGGLLDSISVYTFVSHMPSRAVHLGMTLTIGAMFITCLSIGNAVTRTIITFVSNLECANRILIHGVGIAIGTVGSAVIVVTRGYIGQIVGSLLKGVHVGFTNTVATVMLVDLLGVDYIGRALALYNMFLGSAGLITAPLGGLLYDVTGDYDPPFILATVAGAVATGLVLAATVIDRKQRTRRGQEHTQSVGEECVVINRDQYNEEGNNTHK